MLGDGGFTSGERTRRWRAGASVTFLLGALEQREQLLVVEVARRGEHDVARDVHRPVIRGQRSAADRRDHVRGADHGPAQRMVAEHGL